MLVGNTPDTTLYSWTDGVRDFGDKLLIARQTVRLTTGTHVLCVRFDATPFNFGGLDFASVEEMTKGHFGDLGGSAHRDRRLWGESGNGPDHEFIKQRHGKSHFAVCRAKDHPFLD